MFEDLRNTPQEPAPFADEPRAALVERLPIFSQLKPLQRLVLALLLFLNVAVLGCGCLLASGRIFPY